MRFLVVALLLTVRLLGSAPPVTAQTATSDWQDYDLVQFVALAKSAPASILALDDNGRLVLEAEDGVEVERLRATTGALASQVELLKSWRLLARDGDSVRTTFPILDSAETAELRAVTRNVAPEMARALAPGVERLVDELAGTGRAANAYSIVFSYVLDGLTWEIWEEAGVLPVRELSVERPFWAGEIWAVQPERPAIVGTNKVSDERGALYVSWSHAAIPVLGPFITDLGKVVTLFERFAESRPVGPELRTVFEPFDVLDDRGGLSIPIIVTDADDPVHALSLGIATEIAELAPRLLDLRALRSEFGFRSDAQALVIVYHELMWDVLAELVERGLLSRPRVLDGEVRDPAEVGALIFGVR